MSRSEVNNSPGSYLVDSRTLIVDVVCGSNLGGAAGRAVHVWSSLWRDLIQSRTPGRNCRWSHRTKESAHGPHDLDLCRRLVPDNAIVFALVNIAGDEREPLPQNTGWVGIIFWLLLEVLDRADVICRGLRVDANAHLEKNLARPGR